MKKKRHRVIAPAKARLAAGGGIERYESISTERGYLPCSRCEQESATVPSSGGLCLRCRLDAEARQEPDRHPIDYPPLDISPCTNVH